MRIRTVKPEFFEDETIGSLSRDARLLVIGTLLLADDEGLLRWSAPYVKASLFMYDDDLKESRIARLMSEVESGEIVFPYVGGKTQSRLAWVVKFRLHQRINRPQPSKLPPPSLQNPAVAAAYCRRDGWVCGICAEAISAVPSEWTAKNKPSLDHIIPRSQGGNDYPTNVRIAHFSCNAARGTGEVPNAVNEAVSHASPEWNGSGREQGTGNGSGVAPIAAREDQVLFEAVAEVCKINWREGLTKSARGEVNGAVGQLLVLDGGLGHVHPDEIRRRAANWPSLFEKATLTPSALVKWWGQLSAPTVSHSRTTSTAAALASQLEAEGR